MNINNIRNILNIVFMLLALVAVVMYFVSADNVKMFIYICGAAIVIKLAEFFLRFTNR